VVAVDEIKIGDNDTLSALVANLVDADLLVMLTDTAGLFTADPRLVPDAELIREVPTIDRHIRELAGGTRTIQGTGGMATKIEAAQLAIRSGAEVVIAAGDVTDVLLRIVSGEAIGTHFPPTASKVESRKRWILSDVAEGCLCVDSGAARVLIHQGRSLLPVGVMAVEGDFRRGETVRILDIDGREIARGIANYGARDLAIIKGHHSDEIESLLGYEYGEEVVHRNDLVLL